MTRVLAVGPLPPPIHGAASVNAAVQDALYGRVGLVTVDTSGGGYSGVAYHRHRLLRHLGALRALIAPGPRAARVLYLTAPGGRGVWYLLPLALAARLLRYRTVVHHHSWSYLDRCDRIVALLVGLLGPEQRHVLLCAQMHERFVGLYGAHNAIVCSNAAWVSDAPPARQARAPSRRLRLGYMGTLSVEKGLETVGQLTAALLSAKTPAELWLAGAPAGPADAQCMEALKEQLGERIIHLGSVSGVAKGSFLSGLDAFVFPTRYRHEAEPLVVLEALAAGVPVIAYGRGCIPDLIGDTGLLVAPEDDFVTRALPFLARLASDPAFRTMEGERAVARFLALQPGAANGRRALLQALLDDDSLTATTSMYRRRLKVTPLRRSTFDPPWALAEASGALAGAGPRGDDGVCGNRGAQGDLPPARGRGLRGAVGASRCALHQGL